MNTGKIECRIQGDRHGFTLTELLVVLAMTAVLAATLVPAFAKTRFRTQEVRCLNNLKQMMVAWQNFADDNKGTFVSNPGGGGGWAAGNMANPIDATNAALITNGRLYPYAKSVTLYKCPGSRLNNSLRGISMNCYVGNRNYSYGYKNYYNLTSLSNPSDVFVFIDEDESTINDGLFRIDGQSLSSSIRLNDRPAYYHNGGCGIGFADGRAEIHTWKGLGPEYTGDPVAGVILTGPALEDGQYLLKAATTPVSGAW